MNAIIIEKHAPVLVDHYEGLWRRFLGSLDALCDTAAAVDQEAREHTDNQFRSEHFSYAIDCWRAAAEKAYALRDAIVSELVSSGQREFAPIGGHLRIDAKELEAAGPKVEHKDFSPISVWQEIEHRFGGTSGVERAWEDAAKGIDGFFHSHQRRSYSEPKFTADEEVANLFLDKGKYVLLKSRGVFENSKWEKIEAGHGRCDHQASYAYNELLRHLLTASSAVDVPITDEFASNQVCRTIHTDPRATVRFGTKVDWRACAIIFRKDTTEWHMTHRCADALRKFLIDNLPTCKAARLRAEQGDPDVQE